MKKIKLQSKKILVVGDIMLDKWNYCSSIKLSQEAPVPVVKSEKIEYNLGGAGNVCRNIIQLKSQCTFLGVISNDSNRDFMQNQLYSNSIDYLLIFDNSRVNTVKERYIVDNQHFLRIDHETSHKLNYDIQNNLYESFLKVYKDFDAVILQDYNKGTLTDYIIKMIILECNKAGIKVYVDPKDRISQFANSWLFKPNRAEFFNMTGLGLNNIDDVKEFESDIINLKKSIPVSNLLITLGKNGIALINNENKLFYSDKSFIKNSPLDVTGAGDIVIALYTILDLNGIDESTKLYLCLEGAQKSIIKRGTSVIDLNELGIEV
jgi:D-beta-D-heptose 7-phosphate kinase/D-beta-D-heptose 1-phosphate adenosyltransferase